MYILITTEEKPKLKAQKFRRRFFGGTFLLSCYLLVKDKNFSAFRFIILDNGTLFCYNSP